MTEKQSININLERRARIGEEKRAKTRAKILDAAFDLVGHARGRTLLIEEVCKAGSISRGTFYNHFESIEDLYESLSYELSHDFNDSVLNLLASIECAAQRASSAARYYLHKASDDQRWGWAMINISMGSYIFGVETYTHAEDTIRSGIESGIFALNDPAVGRDILLGTTLASMIHILKRKTEKNFPETVAHQILLGLGVEASLVESVTSKKLEAIKH